MQTSQRSLWTSRASATSHGWIPTFSLPASSFFCLSESSLSMVKQSSVSFSFTWSFYGDIIYARYDPRLLAQPPFSALCCRAIVILITWLPIAFGYFRTKRNKKRKIWVLEWHCKCDRIAVWVNWKKKFKMANELELAAEMSNSNPEQAMELLSSIGKP